MALGTVNGSIAKKGFGFDDGGNDAFVQVSAVERAGLSDLAEGQKLSFEIKVDTKRRKSSAVRPTRGSRFCAALIHQMNRTRH
jgi:cold shock protein